MDVPQVALALRIALLAANRLGSYIELVVSASKSLIDKSRAEIVDLALRKCASSFPQRVPRIW